MSCAVLETASQNPKMEQTPPQENNLDRHQTLSQDDDVTLTLQPPPAQVAPAREEIIGSFAGQKPVYWGLEAPGVLNRLPADSAGVALTLDFCGGPGGNAVDTILLNALRQSGVPATLFLNSRWIKANPSKSRELANDPLFEIANHGTAHSPLSVNGKSAYGIPGTKGTAEIYDEIMTSNAVLEDLTGLQQRFFRPGTAYLDDIAAQIVHAVGLTPVGFSINGDGGATFTASIVAREISAAAPGDIVIAHGNHPEGGTAQGLIKALPAMQDAGRKFIRFPSTLKT
jgi:peptidoglycan/xylan/chitin deacetylase (PgdA/CDA1 family)